MKPLLLLFSVVFFLGASYSQNYREQFKDIYGLDNQLYNGFIYKGSYGNNVKGEAYLYNQFQMGSLVLNEINYENLLLNYDIYKQLLVLKFKDSSGADILLEVPFYKLTEFTLESSDFKLLSQSDSTKNVYQIVGKKPNQFLMRHQKNLNVVTGSSQYEYEFSRDFTKVFMNEENSELIELKNNNSILQYLEKSDAQTLKKWLRKNKIKIQKSTPEELESLSIYLNQL